MCKLIGEQTTIKASTSVKSLENTFEKLVKENENLEKKISENVQKSIKRKNSAPIENLLEKLKKLDEISLHFEQKNKQYETIISTQQKTIHQLTQKNEELTATNFQLSAEKTEISKKLEEIEIKYKQNNSKCKI